MIPLTPLKIKVLGSIFKESGYRAAKHYIGAAKKHHTLNDYPWTERLELAVSEFVSSTQRGIGPARQSCPLPFRRMAKLYLEVRIF